MAYVADNANEIMKTKFNITSVFSAEKQNGNSAKQLLVAYHVKQEIMKFKEWFSNNLTVGSFPFMNNEIFSADNYDIVINMSDEYYPGYHSTIAKKCNAFWFPMNEAKKDVGLNSIYGAMVILFNAERFGEKVYLHCHAGINRSRTVADAYHFMRTGKHYEDIRNRGYINALCANSGRGYLPPKAEMEKFLDKLGKRLSEKPISGGILDECKLGIINNF